MGINTINTDMHSEDESRERVVGMCMSDTDKDKISNKLLLLYLIDSVNKQKNFLGITKLQKLVYLIESILFSNDKRAFSYPFFRWNYGPMSKEIYVEHDVLAKNGLIEKERHIRLTEKGKNILSQCSEILEKNKSIIKLIDQITSAYSKDRTESLKIRVYRSVDPSWGLKLEDIPRGFDLLMDLSQKKDIVEIDNGWIETLDILMDKEAFDSVIDAFRDAQINKSVKYEDLFGV